MIAMQRGRGWSFARTPRSTVELQSKYKLAAMHQSLASVGVLSRLRRVALLSTFVQNMTDRILSAFHRAAVAAADRPPTKLWLFAVATAAAF